MSASCDWVDLLHVSSVYMPSTKNVLTDAFEMNGLRKILRASWTAKKTNYCDRLGRCFRFVCIYACAAVFLCCYLFSVSKDLYKTNERVLSKVGVKRELLDTVRARKLAYREQKRELSGEK